MAEEKKKENGKTTPDDNNEQLSEILNHLADLSAKMEKIEPKPQIVVKEPNPLFDTTAKKVVWAAVVSLSILFGGSAFKNYVDHQEFVSYQAGMKAGKAEMLKKYDESHWWNRICSVFSRNFPE